MNPTRNKPLLLSSFNDAAILATVSLSGYFGILYAFAFSKNAFAPFINAAVLAMDAVILAGFFSHRKALHECPPHAMGIHGWIRVLFCAIAVSSLGLAVLLHVYYVLIRVGIVAPAPVKIPILIAQLSCLFFYRLALTLPVSVSASLRLFKPESSGLLLLSVASMPLVHYLAHNKELFTFLTGVQYLTFFLLLPIGALVLMQMLQHSLDGPTLAAPLVAGISLVHYSMPLVCSQLQQPVESLRWAQAGLAVLVPLTVGLLYCAGRRATAMLLLVPAACSVTGSVIYAGLAERSGEGQQGASLRPQPPQSRLSALLAQPLKRTPDVCLLVYDGYAAPEMMKHYGIDDTPATRYLQNGGFTLYKGVYSVHLRSRESMGGLMNMTRTPGPGIAAGNTVLTFFRDHGYRTHLILNSYLLQGSAPIAADLVHPPWTQRSSLNTLYRGLGGGEFKSEIVFQDFDREQWLAVKRAALAEPSGSPRFLYAHSGFPNHSPNTGCRPDEKKRYEARLAVAREEMRADLDAIGRSGRDAIVIVAGDHGPYLTGDCVMMAGHDPDDLTAVQLGDRYGTMLAIRWPHKRSNGSDSIRVLQDVFHAISAYLLDDDRIWTCRISTETTGYLGIPHGSVEGGIVRVGKDKGRLLLEP